MGQWVLVVIQLIPFVEARSTAMARFDSPGDCLNTAAYAQRDATQKKYNMLFVCTKDV